MKQRLLRLFLLYLVSVLIHNSALASSVMSPSTAFTLSHMSLAQLSSGSVKSGQDDLAPIALEILEQLELTQAWSVQKGKLFSVPTQSWYFYAEEPIQNLLQRLEKNHHAFQHLDVINGTLLLQADYAQAQAILLVNNHHNKTYSGHLSLLHKGEASEMLSPFPWLPLDASVLLDMQTEQPKPMHQWIYELPLSYRAAEHLLEQSLVQQHWQRTNNFGLALKQWQKDEQQLHYYLDQIQGKTLLYLSLARSGGE